MLTYPSRNTITGNPSNATAATYLGAIHDWISELGQSKNGSGTNAITAIFNPAITTLVNSQMCYVRAAGINTIAEVTFTPNSGVIPAKSVVKSNGQPLDIGDITGANHELILKYNSTIDKWFLLNAGGGGVAGSFKAVSNFNTSQALNVTHIGHVIYTQQISDIAITLSGDPVWKNGQYVDIFNIGSGRVSFIPGAGVSPAGLYNNAALRPGDSVRIIKINGLVDYLFQPIHSSNNIPVGAIFYVPYSAVPSGYLECDGTALDTFNYKPLFEKLGYNGGGGASFLLPDLRGLFVRSWASDSATRDVGRVLNSVQAAQLLSHSHTLKGGSADGSANATYSGPAQGSFTGVLTTIIEGTNLTGGAENRPENIALMAIIKY